MSTVDDEPDGLEPTVVLDPHTAIKFMNKRHAVVREGGRTIVISEEPDPVLGRVVLARSSFGDIRNFYHQSVRIGSEDKTDTKPLGEYWLNHRRRRQYEGVTFQPGKGTAGYFNLWRGFGCEPSPGDWTSMKAHIRDVICAGRELIFQWLLAWMAAAVQFPERQAETCVVLRGRQGTGKGILARCFGSLFGQHFVHISNLRHLTGNFNAHLQDALFLFADEVFWIGDRLGESVMKMIITEPCFPLERKGRDVVMVKNYIHLMIASNHDWVIPAAFDDRRFLVLDVSDAHARDSAYFRAITSQMEAGGRAAMLHDLLAFDLSAFDLRQAPQTAGLQEQKLLSMTPVQRWWFEKLDAGHLLPDQDDWDTEVLRESLSADYALTSRNLGGAIPTALGMQLKNLLPFGYPQTFQRMVDSLPGCGKAKKRFWRFPPLAGCRDHFEQITKSQYAWSNAEDVES